MVHSNPRRAEAFVVYGWAARQSHRMAEARQFAQRAEQLAQVRSIYILEYYIIFLEERKTTM